MNETATTRPPSPPPDAYSPPPEPPAPGPERPPLRRPVKGRVIAGVCAGLGRTLGIDPVLVRVILILFTLAGGAGLLLYLLGWVLIPDEGQSSHTGTAAATAGSATSAIVGAGLVLFGSWVLLDRYLPELTGVVGRAFWPTLLIVIGVALLTRRSP